MSSKLELVDSEKHRDLTVDMSQYNTEQNNQNATSVVVSELSALVHEYPIFMTKSTNTGQFQLAAILGFRTGENLFLEGDVWRADFLPLDIQRRPFQLYFDKETGTDRGHIAIDASLPQVNAKSGNKLFDESGKPSQYFSRIKSVFSELMSGTKQTEAILAIAQKYDLIEPVTINMDHEGKPIPIIQGVYSFNKKKLSELTGDALDECHQSGCLQVCHLVLSSGVHLQKLIRWSNAKMKG